MIAVTEQEYWLDGLRVFTHADWLSRFPGLVQGITARVAELDFGPSAEDLTSDGWQQLQAATGIRRVARCRQVQGADVVLCDGRQHSGVHVVGEADALVTAGEGLLLGVTVADCVPVFLVDPERRALGLAHAGWRGIAAGVVEATLARMKELGADVASMYAHLGPAICGQCYEVGPEVIRALGASPARTGRVDLRAHVAQSSLTAGVAPERVTVSSGCTRCDSDNFYSYRRGDRNRRMCAFLGWS
ncbi:MAG: polyphenol oxidase family protein [Gemmatimonadota bacterium]|nr:MAG: polyphenol oxidase family protein [Gemmatimonadota bacterium]